MVLPNLLYSQFSHFVPQTPIEREANVTPALNEVSTYADLFKTDVCSSEMGHHIVTIRWSSKILYGKCVTNQGHVPNKGISRQTAQYEGFDTELDAGVQAVSIVNYNENIFVIYRKDGETHLCVKCGVFSPLTPSISWSSPTITGSNNFNNSQPTERIDVTLYIDDPVGNSKLYVTGMPVMRHTFKNSMSSIHRRRFGLLIHIM